MFLIFKNRLEAFFIGQHKCLKLKAKALLANIKPKTLYSIIQFLRAKFLLLRQT